MSEDESVSYCNEMNGKYTNFENNASKVTILWVKNFFSHRDVWLKLKIL